MRVRYLPRALADLEIIYAYIAKRNPPAADRVTAAIRRSIAGLTEFPEIGQPADAPNVRVLRSAHQPYQVYYSIIGEEIHILHIRHSARRPAQPDDF